MKFEIFIPILPPGINTTYATGRGHLYKTKVAKDWSTDAAKIIGAKAGEIDWNDDCQFYDIEIFVYNGRMDADAPTKLIIDTVTRKLGFDDKRIRDVLIRKRRGTEKGVLVILRDADISS